MVRELEHEASRELLALDAFVFVRTSKDPHSNHCDVQGLEMRLAFFCITTKTVLHWQVFLVTLNELSNIGIG